MEMNPPNHKATMPARAMLRWVVRLTPFMKKPQEGLNKGSGGGNRDVVYAGTPHHTGHGLTV